MKRGLRAAFSILIIILIFAGIIVGIYISQERAKRSAINNAQLVLLSNAKEQSATLVAALNGQFNVLRGAAPGISAVRRSEWNMPEFLAGIASDSGFSSICFISKDGILTDDSGAVVDVSEMDVLPHILSGEDCLEYIPASSSGKDSVMLTVPCMIDGEFMGALAGYILPDEMRTTLSTQVYGGGGYSLIIDSQGSIITNAESEFVLYEDKGIFKLYSDSVFNSDYSVEQLKNDLEQGNSFCFEYSYSGRSRLVAAVPFSDTVLPDVDWYVFSEVGFEELKSVIENGKKNALEVLWVFSVFSGAALFIFIILEFDNVQKRRKRIAQRQITEETLRMNEEQFRIVAMQSGRNVYRYDIAGENIGTQKFPYDGAQSEEGGKFSEAVLNSGIVATESKKDFKDFFDRLKDGNKEIEGVFLLKTENGTQRWFRHVATTLFDTVGSPKTAIISYYDYTEQREREMAYIRWQQEIKTIPENEIALYEWNLSRDTAEDARGLFVKNLPRNTADSFEARCEFYCRKNVYAQDKRKFLSVMNRENLLGQYMNKSYSASVDYRAIADDGGLLWMNISVQLVSYPDTQDIKAYIVNRNIDERKRREDELIDRSERDNITGTYNRATFISKVHELFEGSNDSVHALIILDIDSFKSVNDTFGHTAGDRVLSEYADYISSVLRVTDIVGRIGGDEFMICLPDMGDEDTIIAKVQQLSLILHRKMSEELVLSVSMGIAVFPTDGTKFTELYEKADSALYVAKNSGKNRYVKYDSNMERKSIGSTEIDMHVRETETRSDDSRVLIIGGGDGVREKIYSALADDYKIDKVNGADEAIQYMNSADVRVIVYSGSDNEELFAFLSEAGLLSTRKLLQIIVCCNGENVQLQEKLLSSGADDVIPDTSGELLIKTRVDNATEKLSRAALCQQLSKRVNQQEKELQLTERDALTGLYTRTAFLSTAAGMIAGSKPGTYVISYFDIDSFKVVNDRYGSAVGDRLLRHMAQVFMSGFVKLGGIVGRISADHFITIYLSSYIDSPELVRIWNEASVLPEFDLRVSMSIGRYIVTDLSLSVAAMQDRASLARATVKGRYDIHSANYSEDMRDTILRRQAIINEMDTALANGQFEVWLQPQYNYSTGSVIGAEALVRWNHPKNGVISPSVFIPVFEQNGFIYSLDKYVWEQVCKLLRRWCDSGKEPVPVSVNVSRYDIFMEDFFDTLKSLLEKYALRPELIRIEITETAFSNTPVQIISTVKKLREYGFIIEIDDFGSGYSSLNIIKNVPADILKLDMKFIENDDEGKRAGNVLESIIRMAKWLEMSVIAEGVETRTQAEFLKSVGCVYMQGYFYSRAMPVENCAEWLTLADAAPEKIPIKKINIYDNNAFWDPNSIETLIFNSYIGGAAVYEYRNGEIEVLRANNRYMEVLGSNHDASNIVNINPRSYFNEENYKIITDAVLRAKESGEEVTYETQRVIGSGENEHCEYIRSRVRMIANSEDSLLLYVIIENITQARLREQMLEETTRQLSFLNDAARELISQDNENDAIVSVLRKVLSYFSGSRAYIFEFDYKNETASNTYEVCKAGVSAEIGNLQKVPFDMVPFWLDAFKKHEYISIASAAELDESRREERESLLAQNINSLVAVPVYDGETLVGLIGVDNPLRHDMNVEQLVAIGKYIAVMLINRDANKNKLTE